jgi:hypothetical protein
VIPLFKAGHAKYAMMQGSDPKSSIPHNSQEKKVANTNSIDDFLD